VTANGKGPTLLIRTDLDALPVTEQTQLTYASTVKVKDARGAETGVMHACGHDIHITSLIGVARYLNENKDRWQGTVVFIGQPAEERGEGALQMLNAGLFEKFPKPDYALAMHVDSTLAAGKVGYLAGYTLANVDSVDIKLRGRRLSAHHGRSDCPGRAADPRSANDRQPRDQADRTGRRYRRFDPRRHEAQYHQRRVPPAAHGTQLFRRSPTASAQGHSPQG
jgi:amidohydrolase